MRKLLTVTLLVFVILVSPKAVAAVANGGNPWDLVWAAIGNLQNQIDNIQLIPGPAGPAGPAGATGPIGPQGIQGSSGPALSGINKDLIYVVSSAYTSVLPGPVTFVHVQCNDNNDPVLSGGYQISQGQNSHTEIIVNAGQPTDGTAGWTIGAITDAQNNLSPGQVHVEAYCLRVD